MVNGINSVVNFKELQEQKTVVPPVVSREESPISYTRRIIVLSENWRRRNCGTYPKWIISPAKKILRFCFSFTHYRIEFCCRGRGSRVKAAKIDNIYPRGYDQDLPVRHAKKLAVYISIIRRQRQCTDAIMN